MWTLCCSFCSNSFHLSEMAFYSSVESVRFWSVRIWAHSDTGALVRAGQEVWGEVCTPIPSQWCWVHRGQSCVQDERVYTLELFHPNLNTHHVFIILSLCRDTAMLEPVWAGLFHYMEILAKHTEMFCADLLRKSTCSGLRHCTHFYMFCFYLNT